MNAPVIPKEILGYYGARTTLAFMIEGFAFYFLNLYKTTLAEIKRIQNAQTDIELKLFSLRASALSGYEEIAAHMITELPATEHYFVLRRGETTVDLERKKIEKRLEPPP